MSSITDAVDKFLEAANWLSEEDAPVVTMLRQAAQALDENYTASMVNQARMLYLILVGKKAGDTGNDEAEEFLASL